MYFISNMLPFAGAVQQTPAGFFVPAAGRLI